MYIDVQSVKHNPAAETIRVGGVITLDAAVGVGDGEVIYGHIIGVGDLIPVPSMMKFGLVRTVTDLGICYT